MRNGFSISCAHQTVLESGADGNGYANLYNRTKTNTDAQAAPDSSASAMSSGKADS